MQIILPPYPTFVLDEHLIVEHNGQQFQWNVSPFSKTNFEAPIGMFQHINEWWALQTQEHQQKIYDTYTRIYNTFDEHADIETVGNYLQKGIADLIALHDFDSIRDYVQYKSNIRIPSPPDLPVTFVESIDKNHTRDKTYIMQDYLNLVSMVVQLRLLIPIWGEYISRTSKEIGTNFKELYAFYLINNSNLTNSMAMTKLRAYVNAIVPPSGNNAAILEGISSEDFPTWNLALVVVRRLSMMDIRGVDPKPILVQHISRHIRERVKRSDSSFRGGMIREKLQPNQNVSDEMQLSTLERYVFRPEITSGDIVHIRHLVKDPFKCAQELSPGITKEEVDISMLAYSRLLTHELQPAQKRLLQWVFDPIVSGMGVDFFKHDDVARCLCVVHAVLWRAGHHLLAALATSSGKQTVEEANIITGGYSRGRVSRELLDKLEKLYPYQKKSRSGKVQQVVLGDVDELVSMFMRDSWVCNLTPEHQAVINPKSHGIRRITIPHDFKSKIIELVIYLENRDLAIGNLENYLKMRVSTDNYAHLWQES